ncbi:UNVERIFIED_CONTAM: hypothetical protein Sangu_2323800 [Sesamum angustifolium]|uniref:Uncharacterized protein n=1 Tax=Sesamum angustifolium TaxID=2727405 RepID=A0AAW2L712_9LAMI
MAKMISKMLQEGIIKPNNMMFSLPVLFIKKDGLWCCCVDYRRLNVIITWDGFHIPTADELLDECNGASIFLKLDLCFGYHQISVALEDTHKTALQTVDDHYFITRIGLADSTRKWT